MIRLMLVSKVFFKLLGVFMSNECRISKSMHVYYYDHEVFLFEDKSSAIHIQEFDPWPKNCFLLRLTRYVGHDPNTYHNTNNSWKNCISLIGSWITKETNCDASGLSYP
jgi:hypothetical protein